jgi:ATP-binding cassette subfamily C (CFTR/MRP) protein 4
MYGVTYLNENYSNVESKYTFLLLITTTPLHYMCYFREEVCYTYKIFLLLFTKYTLSDIFLNATWYLFIICSIYAGDQINAGTLFLVMDTLNVMSIHLKMSIPRGIYEIGNLIAALIRIGSFLDSMEELCHRETDKTISAPEIKLSHVNIYGENQKIIDNLDLILGKGLSVITGPVGSGKTLLLKVIMKEHHSVKGEVTVNGSISYASQEPWLFPSTIKQNILFGEDYNEERYLKVLNLCALSEDLQSFAESDNTIVMDRGTNLSGGQQNRINLARAIYRTSDIYLLDDCLSNLDVLVANSIFEKCIKSFLKDKIVLIVSQNQKHIDESDTVIGVNNDTTHLSRTIPKQEKSNFGRNCGGTVSNWGECQDGGDDFDNASESDALIARETCAQKLYQDKNERVKLGTYKKYFVHGGGIIMFSLICVLFIGAQLSKTSVQKLEAKWLVAV